MSHPYHHALSSAKRFGGVPEDYLAIHSWFDASKELMCDPRHRALRHHAQGIFEAERAGVRVVFVDPRNTSRTCPKCGHATQANRPEQSHFRCVACGYQGNADVVASLNIAGVAAGLLRQGPPDTARPSAAPRCGAGQAPSVGKGLDGVKVWASVHADSNLESSV